MEDNTVRGPRGPRGPHGPHGPHGGMGMPGEKAKNSKAAFNNLHLYLKKHVPAIFISLIMGMAGSIISVIGPDKLSDIVNEISKGLFGPMDLDKIKSVCILMMVLYLQMVHMDLLLVQQKQRYLVMVILKLTLINATNLNLMLKLVMVLALYTQRLIFMILIKRRYRVGL